MNLLEAEGLLDRGEPDEAAAICHAALNENPDDAHALYLLGRICIAAARYGEAVAIYRRVLDLSPSSGAWNNLGHALHTVHRFAEARDAFHAARDLDPTNFHAYQNLSTLAASQCEAEEALYWATFARKYADPAQLKLVDESISMPLLGTGKWRDGWRAFRGGIGGQWRRDRQYASEGLWNGTPGKTIVVYGEQGIGDEVMFGSILPDVMRDCDVILECDRRLESLFRRTFPGITIHGTRHDRQIDWPGRIDARIGMGQLGEYYRNAPADFPRKAYLKPEPLPLDRDKPLVGIAWTGGTHATRTLERSLSLEQVCWLRDARPDVQFVSLEYKGDQCPDGIFNPVMLTRDQDYHCTASLVASLDAVVSVTTAVALLAGAVGTRCLVAVPPKPTWHWGYDGEMPWFQIDLFRSRGAVGEVLPQIAGAL